jgi:hypothetical protein
MAVDFDAELTELAAEILRDAVQVYGTGSSLNPALTWNAGMLSSLDATSSFSAITGSLPALTGSFPALTGSFPALTGSFPALTGSFRAIATGAAAQEPQVTLKRAFKLPSHLPGVRLPAEPELAAMARSAPAMAALDALARWLGQDGRLVTSTDDLSDDDATDASGQLGVGPRQLSLLWKYALISGWFELEDSADRQCTWAVTGQTAWRWADGDDSGALHGWAAVFASVAAGALGIMAETDLPLAGKLDFEGQGVALAVMLFVARQAGMTIPDIEDLVRDGALGDYPSFRRKRAWNAWIHAHGHPAHLLLGELEAIGAVALPGDTAGTVQLTPLALWALRKQFLLDRISVPVLRSPSPRMTAADLVALSEAVGEAEFDAAFVEWMHDRDPEQAARELLIYAGSVDPQGRLAAVDIARRIGAGGYRAWKDAMKRHELRGYARISLSMMARDLPASTLPLALEPDADDMAWMATDRLATACDTEDSDPDPDEVAAQFAKAVPDGEEKLVIGLMGRSSHPDSARVLDALGYWHPDRRIAKEARRAARALAKDPVPARAGVR